MPDVATVWTGAASRCDTWSPLVTKRGQRLSGGAEVPRCVGAAILLHSGGDDECRCFVSCIQVGVAGPREPVPRPGFPGDRDSTMKNLALVATSVSIQA
jgi:hypothetical protein